MEKEQEGKKRKMKKKKYNEVTTCTVALFDNKLILITICLSYT